MKNHLRKLLLVLLTGCLIFQQISMPLYAGTTGVAAVFIDSKDKVGIAEDTKDTFIKKSNWAAARDQNVRTAGRNRYIEASGGNNSGRKKQDTKAARGTITETAGTEQSVEDKKDAETDKDNDGVSSDEEDAGSTGEEAGKTASDETETGEDDQGAGYTGRP